MSKMALRLTRVSDGAGWTITPEPGEHVFMPLWVDDEEVWFVTSPTWSKDNVVNGITRLRRDALGPPDRSAD